MHDNAPVEPEAPSPVNRPDHCPRCHAEVDCWVYVGGKMFLRADCHAQLNRGGEPANLRPEALAKLPHASQGNARPRPGA
jgi:hypothetical protein